MLTNKLTSVKNHVARNRAKYGFAAGFITCYAIAYNAKKQWDEFLDEKGLTEEFYTPEDNEI